MCVHVAWGTVRELAVLLGRHSPDLRRGPGEVAGHVLGSVCSRSAAGLPNFPVTLALRTTSCFGS